MVRKDFKNYDGSNGEVYGGILIFLKRHVNHQERFIANGGTMKRGNRKVTIR